MTKAELSGKSLIIELDANSKLGPEIVPGDKHKQSENGRILAGIVERHGLLVGNSLEQCKGLITRRRVTKNCVEESTIDFVLLSEDLSEDLNEIIVDDERQHVLTKLVKTKNGIYKVESDHNPIKLSLNLKSNRK